MINKNVIFTKGKMQNPKKIDSIQTKVKDMEWNFLFVLIIDYHLLKV